jgi:hypothetical protein
MTGMAHRNLAILAAVLFVAVGCGSSSTADAGDTAIDAPAEDSASEVPADAADADADLDVAADAEPDAEPDAESDIVAEAEATPDGDLDIVADAEAEAIADADTDASGCGTDADCGWGLLCCDDRCVNPEHDPKHCGGCGRGCTGELPFCAGGICATTPCDSGLSCAPGTFCCGMTCCTDGQICCDVDAPGPSRGPSCHDLVCPPGCPLCL